MIKELPPYGILSRVYDDFLSEDPMGDWQGTKIDDGAFPKNKYS